MEEEVWVRLTRHKDYKDFVGYEVSSLGNVRRFKNGEFIKLAYSYSKKNVNRVRLVNTDGEIVALRAHLLVWDLFVGTPRNGSYVKFKDGCKSNLRVENLYMETLCIQKIRKNTKSQIQKNTEKYEFRKR